jgi:catechol 2,3-dioxygenase-like lactoylglutathione lyase family enzyme
MNLETGPALRLHSVMLGIADTDRSIAFYTEKLGMTVRARFGDFALLQTAGLALTLSTQLVRARPAAGPIPVEIVLAVDGVRDAYDVLRSRGVTFLNGPHTIDGTNDGVHFQDPDGHLFSLFGRP